MLPRQILLALAVAMCTSAIPLNINLGAYSPALVVGDGEISFDSAERASQLMETLASGAATAGLNNGGQQQQEGGNQQQQQQPQQQQGGGEAQANVVTGEVPTPSGEAESAETTVAAAIRKGLVGGSIPNMAKRSIDETTTTVTDEDLTVDRSVLEDRAVDDSIDSATVAWATKRDEGMAKMKRSIEGFREALNFARDGQKNQPKIELGTPASGVGILVNPGLNVPVGSAAAGGKAARQKRDLAQEEPKKEGITLLAITEI